MLFFLWLAGGGIVFSVVERKYGNHTMNWSYVNALYFCDVTILTVGFGDLYPTSDIGRGLVFPFSVGGIIMLGLVVASISRFATDIGSENIIQKHVERTRVRTIGRTVTSSLELEHRRVFDNENRPAISAPFNPVDRTRTTTIKIADDPEKPKDPQDNHSNPPLKRLQKVASLMSNSPRQRKPKLILLREEKDRFNAMRNIQHSTARFKRWYALCLSTIAFGLLWAVGAVVFWQCEKNIQGMTYFQALYFCYVSLLTIGYGDLAPQSNPGRPFFVLWSLIAVPTMTILVSDLGETVINKFKHGTFKLADFTVLPKEGVWREIVDRHPWLYNWLLQRKRKKETKRRLEEGFQVGPEPEPPLPTPTIEELAKDEPVKEELARRLAAKIRKTADDMKDGPRKRYSYEEWVEFTQLIRFTANQNGDVDSDEDEGLIEWDWIGEDSPMMSKGTEAEFVLDRLCESMQRYIKLASTPARDDSDDLKQPPQPRRGFDSGNNEKEQRDVPGSSSGGSEDDISPLEKR
jgi:potassium channel subfamily K